MNRPAILTAWAAVSVCETIRQIAGLQARIKWPNDVLVQGKKVCGILIEQGLGTVAGIGVNINQIAEAFHAPGLTQGSSLSLLTGKALDCIETTRRLIMQLDAEYDRLRQGDRDTLEACWKRHVGLIGCMVAVECVDQTHYGRLLDMTFAGLHLEQADRENIVLSPESIKHLELIGNILS